MSLNENIGIGRIRETGQLIIIYGPIEITIDPEDARIIRDGLCSQIGIPAKEEVENFEFQADYSEETREL